MAKEIAFAALVVAASVAAAGSPSSPPSHPGVAPSRRLAAVVPSPAAGARPFQFRGLMFLIPVNWSVQRAESTPPRVEYVAGPVASSGPRLTFSDSVQLIQLAAAPAQRLVPRGGAGLTVERFEMPNAATRGVLYVIRGAGISISAQVPTDAEAREADAVVYSARWAVPRPAPKAS